MGGAAFETAFHRTIPLSRALYGVPYEWYEKYGIKRMGYHGASHSYVADTLAGMFGATGRAVSCHLWRELLALRHRGRKERGHQLSASRCRPG